MIAAIGAILLACGIPAAARAGQSDGVHLLWRRPVDGTGQFPWGIPAANKSSLFVISSSINAYSLTSGAVEWLAPVHSYLPRSLVTAKGMVFVPEAIVSALDAKTGRTIWEFTPDANASLGRATTQGSALYFGTSGHRLYALRTSDGKRLWDIDLGPDWEYPAVVRGVAVSGGELYATLEQWRTPNGTSSSGWLIAVNAKTRKTLWRYSTGSGSQRRGLSSSPVVTPRLVLVSDYLSNAIEAVDRRTGQSVWRFHGESGFVGFPEAPIVAGSTVYAGSGDTYVYALDLSSGHLLWRTKMPTSNEAYALCGKSLLVNNSRLAALDPRSGHIAQVLLGDNDEFATSKFAVVGKRAFIVGPRAMYAFACR